MKRSLLLLAILGLGTACSGDAATDCEALDNCLPGTLCIEDVCRELCNTDSDCNDAAEVCTDGVCLLGVRPVRPTVAITPDDAATDVSVDTTIVLAFSAPMDQATVEGGGCCLSDRVRCIAGSFAWPSDTVAIFTPDAPLQLMGTYFPRVTNAVADADGILFQGHGGPGCDAPDYCTEFATESLPSPPTVIITVE